VFRPKCGNKVDDSDAFCRSCGHLLSEHKATSTKVAPANDAAGTVGVGKAIEPTKRGVNTAVIVRVVVLLFALGFVLSKVDWIQDAALDMGGFDAALREEEKDAVRASDDAIASGRGLSDEGGKQQREAVVAPVAPTRVTSNRRTTVREREKEAEPRTEPGDEVQARGYKDEDGKYRARRANDGEAQYQLNAINEDLIVLVPECANAEPAMKLEIDKSLKLDEYELSNLISRDEARAFHSRVVEQGCF
jgi:hypothetical protein